MIARPLGPRPGAAGPRRPVRVVPALHHRPPVRADRAGAAVPRAL